MKNYCLPFLAVLCLASSAHGQKKVFSYSFQFEKAFLAKGQYSTYFLDDPADSTFALILKDNKKAEFLWLSRDFKLVAKVPAAIESTLLDNQKHKYVGGTAAGHDYHFIYQTGNQFDMETVDFNGHTVSDKKILELPKTEKSLASFSDYNTYYCLTVDDKSDILVIYSVGSDAGLTRHEVPFPTPVGKLKLSTYLGDMAVIKSTELADLFTASHHFNKLYSRKGEFIFILNTNYPHLRVFSIDTRDFSVKDKDDDESSAFGLPEKAKGLAAIGLSSYLEDSVIYSFGLGKTDMHICIQRLSDGSSLGQFGFGDDAAFNTFAGTPTRETRYIKEVDSKDLTTWKKLFDGIRYGGLLGCIVSSTGNGKLLLTAGAVNQFGGPTGGGMDHYMGGFDRSSTTTYSNGMTVPNYNPYMYRLPGTPSFMNAAAAGTYYTSTYFRIILDPATMKPAKGIPGRPLFEQIRDFVYAKGKSKAPNQFAMGKNQYYGYYDEDAQQYVIEQIPIR